MRRSNVKLTIQPVTDLSDQSTKIVVEYDYPSGKGIEAFPFQEFTTRARRPKSFEDRLQRTQPRVPAVHRPDESGKQDWSTLASEWLTFSGHLDNRTALARLDLGTFGLPRSSFLPSERCSHV